MTAKRRVGEARGEAQIIAGWARDGDVKVIPAPHLAGEETPHHIEYERRVLGDDIEDWNRWRYRRDLATVFWWESPSLQERNAVQTYLADGGYEVDKQVFVALNSTTSRKPRSKMPSFDNNDLEKGRGLGVLDATHYVDAPTEPLRRWLDRIGDSLS